MKTAIQAIEYASDNGATISNNSWGFESPPISGPDPLKQAIERSEMLFVASAGNGGFDGKGDNNDTGRFERAYPASYDSPNILSGTGQPLPSTLGKTVTGDMANAGNAVTDTAPRISRMSPMGSTSDSTPKIRATVVDLQEMLSKSDVDLSVDGAPRTNFSYNANSGALSFTGAMKEGRHSVRGCADRRVANVPMVHEKPV